MCTKYQDLSESEKELDRDEARKMIFNCYNWVSVSLNEEKEVNK